MDKEEARSVLALELGRFRSMPYSDLAAILDETKHIDMQGPSDQIDISIM